MTLRAASLIAAGATVATFEGELAKAAPPPMSEGLPGSMEQAASHVLTAPASAPLETNQVIEWSGRRWLVMSPLDMPSGADERVQLWQVREVR